MTDRICADCNKPLPAQFGSGRKRKYCLECRPPDLRQPRPKSSAIVKCVECGRDILRRRGRRKYCSVKCRTSAKQAPCSDCGELMFISTTSRPAGLARCRNCRNRRPVRGYKAAHIHVTATRGRAGDHTCSRCASPAVDWAYDHQDPNEVMQVVKTSGGGPRTYSVDPDHYIPLCRTCHLEFDDQHRMLDIPAILTRPPIEWSLDEMGSGWQALGTYIRLRRQGRFDGPRS